VIRQPKTAKRVPKCQECGSDCYCLGYKVEVPKKEDVRGWRKLRDDCRARTLDSINQKIIAGVREQHAAERRIVQLTALPENRDRAKIISGLKKKLQNQPLVGTPAKRPPSTQSLVAGVPHL